MTNKRKIIHLLLNLGIGGAERFVVDLSNEFSEDSECIIYLTEEATAENRYYQTSLNKNVQIKTLRFANSLILRYFYEVFRMILKEKPSVIQIHSPSLILPLVPIIFLFGRKVRFIQTLHSNPLYINYKLKSLFLPFARFLYRNQFITTVAVSKTTSSQFLTLFGVPCTRVIYNARFNLGITRHLDKAREELNYYLNDDDVVLLHIGRFAEVKNQRMLLEVVNRIIQEGYHVKLFIIGNNFQESNLIDIACDGICFLGERLNIIDYLSLADGLCISSKSEAMPLVLIEAMSIGCIPIVTNVGGIGEIVEDGINGFVSKEVEFECYYNTLKRFIENRKKISKTKIQLDYYNYFSPNKCVDSYRALYFKR